jgi:hypothetical protein
MLLMDLTEIALFGSKLEQREKVGNKIKEEPPTTRS